MSVVGEKVHIGFFFEIANTVSAVLAVYNPRRIKASHRRRGKVAVGHSVYIMNNPLSGTDPTGYTKEGNCTPGDPDCGGEVKTKVTSEAPTGSHIKSNTVVTGSKNGVTVSQTYDKGGKLVSQSISGKPNGAGGQMTSAPSADAAKSAKPPNGASETVASSSSGGSAFPMALVIPVPVPRPVPLPPVSIPGEMPTNSNDSAEPITLGTVVVKALEEAFKPKTYVTYTLTKMGDYGPVIYYGRASGRGTPEQIVQQRYARHWFRRAEGYGNPQLDKYAYGDAGYLAIRGREQQIMDRGGGVGTMFVGNYIRGVAKSNPFGRDYHDASDLQFGNVHGYTGND